MRCCEAAGGDPDDTEATADCPGPSTRWTISNGALTPSMAPPPRETATFDRLTGWPEVEEAPLDEPALVRAGVETGDAPLGGADGADA